MLLYNVNRYFGQCDNETTLYIVEKIRFKIKREYVGTQIWIYDGQVFKGQSLESDKYDNVIMNINRYVWHEMDSRSLFK